MKRVHCPACDLQLLAPLESLALGVALGAAFPDMHSITELMCAKHRTPYVLAMARASVFANDSSDDGGTSTR